MLPFGPRRRKVRRTLFDDQRWQAVRWSVGRSPAPHTMECAGD
jgi:hypothetical protein